MVDSRLPDVQNFILQEQEIKKDKESLYSYLKRLVMQLDNTYFEFAEILNALIDGLQLLSIYKDATGEQDITSGDYLTWDSISRKDPAFSFSEGDAEITIEESGDYLVTVDVSAYITSDTSSRSTSYFRIDKDSGSGYSEIRGTRGFMYHRLSGESENTGSVTRVISVESGDKIKVYAARLSGNDTISTLSDGCRLTIKKQESAP